MRKCIILFAGFALLLAGCPRAADGGISLSTVTEYAVTFSAKPAENGTLTAKIKDGKSFTSGHKVAENTVLEFTAKPKDGFVVEKWEGITAEPPNAETITVTVDKPLNVTVFFKEIPKPAQLVTVTVTQPKHGSITANPTLIEGTKGEQNTEMIFTVIPHDGYLADTWTIVGGEITKGGKQGDITVTVKLTADTTVVVALKEKPVTVTFKAGSNGTLKAGVDGKVINTGTATDKGKTVTFTATPDNGYGVKSWKITGSTFASGGKAGDTTATVSLSADTAVMVTFEYTGSYTLDGVPFTMKLIPAVTDTQLTDGYVVSLSGYSIGETEVTNKLYNKVLKKADGDTKPESDKTWFDCIVFCNKLTEQIYGLSECVYYSNNICTAVYTEAEARTEKMPFMNMQKKGFRLPTEAEWMYAAKGGQNGPFAGSKEAELGDIAWYRSNAGEVKHEVKTKTANGYSLYDMCGNIHEWCWNDSESTAAESLSGQDPVGKKDAHYMNKRILKGGSYQDPYGSKPLLESNLNLMKSSTGIPASSNNKTYGFRIVSRP